MRFPAPASLTLFRQDARGSVLPIFAFALVPLIGLVGAAVDYSRASTSRVNLQAAIDAGVLTAAGDGTAQWELKAAEAFRSVASPAQSGATPQFSASGGTFTGTVNTTVPAALLTPGGYRAIPIAATATALVRPAEHETSCILTLGQGQSLDAQSMTFSGSPNVSLAGCTLRSNTSMKCNGHNTGALASVSAGTTTNCSNPLSGAKVVGDIYQPLAANIVPKCSSRLGARWSPGSPPPSTRMVTIFGSDRTEYHVCGDLTLSGIGSITGDAPAGDTVIVIENGRLILSSNAAIRATRTAFVFTGDNTASASVQFPNGNGQSASLTVSPPTTSTNPWAGIAMYQDPALSQNVDSGWGPGATLVSDGVIYMPRANLSLGGNAGSGTIGCTKIVANTVTIGGAVDMRQSSQACATAGVKQWSVPRSMTLTN
jgi:hypothetical protein